MFCTPIKPRGPRQLRQDQLVEVRGCIAWVQSRQGLCIEELRPTFLRGRCSNVSFERTPWVFDSWWMSSKHNQKESSIAAYESYGNTATMLLQSRSFVVSKIFFTNLQTKFWPQTPSFTIASGEDHHICTSLCTLLGDGILYKDTGACEAQNLPAETMSFWPRKCLLATEFILGDKYKGDYHYDIKWVWATMGLYMAHHRRRNWYYSFLGRQVHIQPSLTFWALQMDTEWPCQSCQRKENRGSIDQGSQKCIHRIGDKIHQRIVWKGNKTYPRTARRKPASW